MGPGQPALLARYIVGRNARARTVEEGVDGIDGDTADVNDLMAECGKGACGVGLVLAWEAEGRVGVGLARRPAWARYGPASARVVPA